jgi:hypothetical protein
MNSLLCVAAAALALTAQTVAALADGPPKFADYPVKVYAGKVAKPRLVTPDLRDRRELFEAAASEGRIDAAGHYFVVKLPCGSACAAPHLLDARTGKIIEVFTISGWHETSDDFDPVASRANSRLIVFRGARNEAGIVGNHFYLVEDGDKLKHLHTQDTEANFETSPKIE